jgi:hypothetical protein
MLKSAELVEVAKAGGLNVKKNQPIFDEVYESSKEIRLYIP